MCKIWVNQLEKEKIVRSFLIVVLFFFPFKINAAYFDRETSAHNSMGASSLNILIGSTISNFSPSDTSSGLNLGDSVHRDTNIINSGEVKVKYRVDFSKVSGDDILCHNLQLQAKLNGSTIYNNNLSDFSYKNGAINIGSDEDWDFYVTLPSNSGNALENLDCNFSFVYTAWQTDFADSTHGWLDRETLTGNDLHSSSWAPIISNVNASNSLATQDASNNDMAKIQITWNTQKNATSNVVYDTVSHSDCSSYANSSMPQDTAADNTSHTVTLSGLAVNTKYYYRVVSIDSNGNQSCSNQFYFTTPPTTVDVPNNDIVLNEFVPNPDGDDSASKPNGEWVELYNTSGSDVGVNGWVIYDSTDANGVVISSSNTNTGDTVVPSHGWLVVYLQKSYLNNSGGDSVKLYSGLIGSGGTLIDSHSYSSSAPSGKSYARFPDGVGVWIDPDTTPGGKNKLKSGEMDAFRKQTITDCFNGVEIKKTNKDICRPEFLEYLGMLNDKKDKLIDKDMYDKFNLTAKDDDKTVSSDSTKNSDKNTTDNEKGDSNLNQSDLKENNIDTSSQKKEADDDKKADEKNVSPDSDKKQKETTETDEDEKEDKNKTKKEEDPSIDKKDNKEELNSSSEKASN